MGGPLTSQVRIIVLYIPETGPVQDVQLRLVRLCNVGEILLIAAVHIRRVGLALMVAQVVPIWCSERKLDVSPALLRHNRLKVLDLVNVCALTGVLDLACADHRLARNMVSFQECGHVRNVCPEHVYGWVLHFLHAFQTREERAPEHVAAAKGMIVSPIYPIDLLHALLREAHGLETLE